MLIWLLQERCFYASSLHALPFVWQRTCSSPLLGSLPQAIRTVEML